MSASLLKPRALTGAIVGGLLALLLALPAQAERGWGRERLEFGRPVRILPGPARIVPYGGVRYGFHEGYWYAPGRSSGYVVVRPPYGVVVNDLPLFATVLTVGAASYWYANDVYYRAAPAGGYEVVAPPAPAPAAPAEDKLYVYPARGQGAEQQATDEYDCHRWAVTQSGFDPSAAATGNSTSNNTDSGPERQRDYRRARSACLEGRGYTVR